jgi:CRISPR-associated protein Cas1
VKIQAVCDGYDPMIGILHDQRHKENEVTASFALDLMEPHRPVVDRRILKLIAEETFSGADFDVQSDGVVRTSLGLAKRLVAGI